MKAVGGERGLRTKARDSDGGGANKTDARLRLKRRLQNTNIKKSPRVAHKGLVLIEYRNLIRSLASASICPRVRIAQKKPNQSHIKKSERLQGRKSKDKANCYQGGVAHIVCLGTSSIRPKKRERSKGTEQRRYISKDEKIEMTRALAFANVVGLGRMTSMRSVSTQWGATAGRTRVGSVAARRRACSSSNTKKMCKPPPSAATEHDARGAAAISQSANVMVFSTTYCPYCSRVRTLLDDLRISHTAWDVDAMPRGDDIRAWLLDSTGQRTVPNVFIGGKQVGGCEGMFPSISPSISPSSFLPSLPSLIGRSR